jgi:hypothetical protein
MIEFMSGGNGRIMKQVVFVFRGWSPENEAKLA